MKLEGRMVSHHDLRGRGHEATGSEDEYIPTAEEIYEPNPYRHSRQKELPGRGHEEYPTSTHQGEKLESRGRGSNPE
jgi:hypothetical protein